MSKPKKQRRRKHKNTVPAAPEDFVEQNQLFTHDGRKLEDKEFVGARTPDADPPTVIRNRPRGKRKR